MQTSGADAGHFHEKTRAKVTLSRVPGGEEGQGYSSIPFVLVSDGRGDHMRGRVKRRCVRRLP